MKTAITAIIAAVVLIGLAFPSNANAFNLCHNLSLSIIPSGNYYISRTYCTKGTLNGMDFRGAEFAQDAASGPDCFVEVHAYGRTKDQFVSSFKVHQNLCALEAGNITVSPEQGSRPVYKITKGSWSKKRAGLIEITAFDPP